MIDIGLIIALAIGTAAMLCVMLFVRKNIGFSVWKVLIISPVLTVTGLLSVKMMYFIENGSFSGLSFYGAVFFVPLLFIPIALIFRETYGKMLDICAPSICAMLAIIKVGCIRTGCCGGRYIFTNDAGDGVFFPSREVELSTAVILMIVLVIMIKKGKFTGLIYPWFMVLYGVTRFILNFFRDTTPFIWIIPAGTFWSIIAVIIGLSWLIIAKRIAKKKVSEQIA